MFIRAKKIKNQKYAYLVENRWSKTKKNTRQKTKKYLGKILYLQPSVNISFNEYFKLIDNHSFFKNKSLDEAILDLVRFELLKHGFKEKDKDIWVNMDIRVDIDKKEVKQNNKTICISINQGYISEHTLKELFYYLTPRSYIQKDLAKSLATVFVSAGISIEPNFFISFFQQYFLKNRQDSPF